MYIWSQNVYFRAYCRVIFQRRIYHTTLYILLHYIACVTMSLYISKIRVAWSRMLHALFNLSCNLSRNRFDIQQNYFQIACFDWLYGKNIAKQVARGMLHCATAEKCLATFRQSLRNVQQKFCMILWLPNMLHLAVPICIETKSRDKLHRVKTP